MTVMRAIFIRSAETDWNHSKQFQGWLAIPLNEHGRQQAGRLANFIRHIGLKALYSSDLRRATETAQLLAARLGYEPQYDARLRERNIGSWQGLTLEQMQSWFPDSYADALADPLGYHVPDGESRADVQQRALAAFEDIIAADAGATVGVVSHATAIRAILDVLIPNYEAAAAVLGNSSVTTIARENAGDDWRLVAVNDLAHLEGLQSRSARELEQGQ